MPQQFDRMDIAFQYPDNWTLDDADAVAGRHSVTVYAPGGAFWTVAVHPGDADPLTLARSIVGAMQQEYSGVEVEELHEVLRDTDVVGFELAFYYLDFVNTAEVRALRARNRTYTVFCQGEDREFQQFREVFRAMTASLLGDPGR